MEKYTGEELLDALQVVSSIISKCEKIQPKFAEKKIFARSNVNRT